ncbi:hypothetical protein C8R43DRAFT_697249 [Mycena crocata]|nr:hypothetical protein C8R43DRAFT_697249 [Mycena crocata]
MRNFSPALFPASAEYLKPFKVFDRFPKDIGLAILEQCSPYDLAQLALTSGFLRSFIQLHNHLWTSARSNLARGNCPRLPPPPVVQSTGNYSEQAYASWLFGGGMCSMACKKLLASDASLWTDKSKKYADFSWGKWLPRAKIEINNNGSTFQYSRRARQNAERERQQAIGVDAGNSRRDPRGFPVRTVQQLNEECNLRAASRHALTQNANELADWHKLYLEEKAAVSRTNFAFLKLMSALENQKVQGVMRCPTIATLYRAFTRDLALITHTVWKEHRPLILAELKSMQHGVFPEGMDARRNDKIRCPYCPRLMKVTGMSDHIVIKHKGRDPDNIPGIPETHKMHCPDCPDSKRLFTTRGMKDHQRNKHSEGATI